MKKLIALLCLSSFSVGLAAAPSSPEKPSILVVGRLGEKQFDLTRLLHASGCEYQRQRIKWLEQLIERNPESDNTEEKKWLEHHKAGLAFLLETKKAWRGEYTVTIFENADRFIVAYFSREESGNAFVCSLSKDDYTVMNHPSDSGWFGFDYRTQPVSEVP
jgi:hypothetical protein